MPDPVPQPEPWERQPGEPNLWFARFERYRLDGPSRSLRGTVNAERATKGNKRHSGIPGAWSRTFVRWRWRERAEEWDEQERQKARESHAKEVDEMNRRHIQEAKALQNKAVQRLQSLNPDDISAFELLRFMLDAAKLERTARGEPETIEEKRHAGPGGGQLKITVEEAVAAVKELEEWERSRLPVERNGDG